MTIDCSGMTAKQTEELIWTYTDQNYAWAFSQYGNPTFVKYSNTGKVIDSVSFIHPYVGLRHTRPSN